MTPKNDSARDEAAGRHADALFNTACDEARENCTFSTKWANIRDAFIAGAKWDAAKQSAKEQGEMQGSIWVGRQWNSEKFKSGTWRKEQAPFYAVQFFPESALKQAEQKGRREAWEEIADAAERGGFYNTAKAYREQAKASGESKESGSNV